MTTASLTDGYFQRHGDNAPNNAFTGETEVKVWGLGVVQEIDAAAMSVWVKYRHLSADTSGNELPLPPTTSTMSAPAL